MEIADSFLSAQCPGKGGKTCDSCGSRYKLQPHQTGKLGEIAHGGLTRVVLEVGVRDERCCRVEDQARLQRSFCIRVQRKPLLQCKHQGYECEHERVEHQHGDEVLFPVLFPGEGVSSDFSEEFRCPLSVAGRAVWLDQLRHGLSERPGKHGGNDEGKQE